MKRTVLLVDDDDSVLETISPMLTDAGYDVLGVAKARIGFDEFQSRPVDLIITDILMIIDIFAPRERQKILVLLLGLLPAIIVVRGVSYNMHLSLPSD